MNRYANNANYTVNPLTGKYIMKGKSLYNKLARIFFTDGNNNLTDERIPTDYTAKDYGTRLGVLSQTRLNRINKEQTQKQSKRHRVADPMNEGKHIYVGSSTWNDRYKHFNWNGKEFTGPRTIRLNSMQGSVQSRREYRRLHGSKKADRLLESGEILNNEMGYKVVYYNTSDVINKEKRGAKQKDTRDFEISRQGDNIYVNRRGERDNKQKVKMLYCKQEDDMMDKASLDQFCKRLVEFIKKGETYAPQYLIDLGTIDSFTKIGDNDDDVTIREVMYLRDGRAPHEKVLIKGHEREWCEKFLKEYQNMIEALEMRGSGWIYEGNLGVSLVMIPLKVCVGAAIKTPAILGYSVLNACIDDNRCLQRSLILACDERIVKSNNVCHVKAYGKYWKKADRNLVFGHTIPEIESTVNIQDNTPFVACEENFKALEDLLDIYITCYQFNMNAGFDLSSTTAENRALFTVEPLYPISSNERQDKTHIYLCVLNDIEKELKHFVYIKDAKVFSAYVTNGSDTKHNYRPSQKVFCRWCLYSNCKSNVLKHEIRCHPEKVPESERYILESGDSRLRWTNQRYQMYAPVVMYADFESSINEQGEHNPIMLSVACVSRIPNVQTEYKVFRGPNENAKDFIPFIEYLERTRSRIVDELYDERKMVVTPDVTKDYEATEECPFCHIPLITKDEKKEISAITSDEQRRRLLELESLYEEDPELLTEYDLYELEEAKEDGSLEKAHKATRSLPTDSVNWKRIREDYHTNKSRMVQLAKKCKVHKATKAEKEEYEKLKSTQLMYARVKVRHHAHIAGEYSNGVESRQYAAGDYICTCCDKCNFQLSFNKTNYKLPVYFHNGSRYDNAFIMKIIHNYKQLHPNSKLDVIPTAMDKEMLITLDNIDFKDSYKMISSKLKDIVAQTLGSDLNNYPVTKQLLKHYLEDHNKNYDETYIELMTRKEPMFYNLITSYKTLSNRYMPKIDDCYDVLSNSFMTQEDYNHMKTLWATFNIKNWGEYYELYNILDVTLLADAFEHFRTATYNSFGVDAAHYLTTPQMSYSLFLKFISNNDETRFIPLAEKWASYQMKIGANEGCSIAQLQDIFVKRMTEYQKSGGIRLLSKNDMDTFISLKDNLRGGITQITTRYATVEDSSSQIYYLDANNLYGGTMHRMMPYDIVYDTTEEWKLINRHGPTAWVNSLGTYDEYGYFIECDVHCKDYDKFNDLPFFPTQRVGEYSPYMLQYAKDLGIEDMLNEKDKTQKLICDLCPKKHYVVHYSMLQLGLQQGYKLTKIHKIIKFKQAPFIFEYVNQLSDMRAKASSSVLKNLFKLLANSIYGKFVETGLNRMKVKFASTKKEQDAIMQKYNGLIDGMELIDDLWVGKIFNPVKRMTKPFFIGFAILDMSKYIIYDFYYNKLKKTFANVTLLGQDTDSLIVKITDNDITTKMLDDYKSYDFSELDTSSYFYNKLVEYYNIKVNNTRGFATEFPTLNSFVNFNKKVAGPIFKDEHKGHRITEFCGLRPKLYCILDEKNVIHNAAKGVPRTVTDSVGNIMKIKNMETYKRVLFGKSKDDAVLMGNYHRIANRELKIETTEQTKVLFTCLDNKRYVCDDGIHTLAFREGMM